MTPFADEVELLLDDPTTSDQMTRTILLSSPTYSMLVWTEGSPRYVKIVPSLTAEDDGGPQVVNHHKVPRRKYAPGDKVTLRNGGKLDQVPETWSYIWSEMPGMLFSDSYINEWGDSITSDNCPSREEKPEITDGGIRQCRGGDIGETGCAVIAIVEMSGIVYGDAEVDGVRAGGVIGGDDGLSKRDSVSTGIGDQGGDR